MDAMSRFNGKLRKQLTILLLLVTGITIYFIHFFSHKASAGETRQLSTSIMQYHKAEVYFGHCRLVLDGTCPDPDVQFFLYTRKNPTDPQLIDLSEGILNVSSSYFNETQDTKFVIHGYNSDMHLDVLEDIRKGYLEEGEFNVIAVNWPRLCPGPCYPTAVHNAEFAGKCIAQMIQALRLLGAYEFHVVGFSLGAHVAAFAANNLQPYKLRRITGLDPAMPLFVTVDKEHKLDPSDAEFVDVIHTNAFMQGKFEASGDVDFYVNGGINQPGCWSESSPFGCHHQRAAVYFAESINTRKGFYGWLCKGYFYYLLGLCPPRFPSVLMGDHVPDVTRGFYLVKTASHSPFALGPRLVAPMDDIIQRHRDVDNQVDDSWASPVPLGYESPTVVLINQES